MDQSSNQAVKMTRLPCHRLRSNQVRLALSLLAYNLGNLLPRLVLSKRIENCSLTSLQQRAGEDRRTGGKHAMTGCPWRKDIWTGGGSERCWAGSRHCCGQRDRSMVVRSAAASVYSG